ncbi:MAG: DNA topoisomerase IV subunit A [Kiritimatiellae bacterium]|nr:DNA topoisomerase IV subunit A [Kiritimatiellia bacterium]
MAKKKDITPPPRRVTQELFIFDEFGNATQDAVSNVQEDANNNATSAVDASIKKALAGTNLGGVKKTEAVTTESGAEPPADEPPAEPPTEPSGDDDVQPQIPAKPAVFDPRHSGPLAKVMDDNFLQFASYTICSRAIPTVEDGLKPVQRRILHSLKEKDDGRFIKVANIVGHTMQYHPHGDASIKDALVNLENKGYLIEGQGNFGNIFTGDGAAAGRYIECRLSQLAREQIFNKKTTEFIPSYDGRNEEPVLLPSKLPLLLMMGAEGIAVGLSTRIMSHNFIELLEAQIAILQNKPFTVLPDFLTGGLIDVSEYNDGFGRIRTRAKMEVRDKNTVVITELPFGQTTDSLTSSIEDATRAKKVPIRSVQDSTSDHVEIILTLIPGTAPEKAIKALYAFTSCEYAVTANCVVIEKNRPCERTVSEILRANTEQLQQLLKRELEIKRDELEDQRQNKTLVQIFIEERIYKRIEKCTTAEQINEEIREGFKPFRDKLYRDIRDEDIEMLLAVQIRRISLYDMNKNRKEIDDINTMLEDVNQNLGAVKAYTLRYLKDMIKRYQYVEREVEVIEEKPNAKGKGTKQVKKRKKETVEQYPRHTTITTFDAIEVREITASECSICYDAESGYLGYNIKGGEELFKCSSLDKLIVVWKDGKFKLIPAPEKLFVDNNMLYAAIFNRDKEYTAIYTDKEYPISYIKRFSFGGLIANKDYSLLPNEGQVRFLEEGTPAFVWIKYKPAKSQRIIQKVFKAAEEVAVKGVKAKGKQITLKAIQHIASGEKPPRWWDEAAPTDKGNLLF